LYSNLRFVISASLVGCAGLIAVLALLPATFEERLLASDEASAQPCKEQHWLQLDPNCLSRRGMPWVADAPAPNTTATATESVPEQAVTEQAVTETQPSASAAERREIEATAPRQEAPVPPVVAEEPAGTTQRSDITAPQPAVPQQEVSSPPVATEPPPPVTAERHVPKPHASPPATRRQPRPSCTRSGTSRGPQSSRKHPHSLRRKQRARIVARNRPTRPSTPCADFKTICATFP